jgi:hypothetical protein
MMMILIYSSGFYKGFQMQLTTSKSSLFQSLVQNNIKSPIPPIETNNQTLLEPLDMFMHKIWSFMINDTAPDSRYGQIINKDTYLAEAEFIAFQVKDGLEIDPGCRRIGVSYSPYQRSRINDIAIFELRQLKNEMKVFKIIVCSYQEESFICSIPNLKFDDFKNFDKYALSNPYANAHD